MYKYIMEFFRKKISCHLCNGSLDFKNLNICYTCYKFYCDKCILKGDKCILCECFKDWEICEKCY